MSTEAVVIGIGNVLRGDDGIGPVVAAAVADRDLPGVRVVVAAADPSDLLDLWAGVALAVVVDAVRADSAAAGEILLFDGGTGWPAGTAGSSHALDIADAVRLGAALDRTPARVLVIGVVAASFGYGAALSAPVADAVPVVVHTVLAALGRCPGRSTGAMLEEPERDTEEVSPSGPEASRWHSGETAVSSSGRTGGCRRRTACGCRWTGRRT